MIYFLPNDRPFRQRVVDEMKSVIRQTQTFYAEQMQAHGYGNSTFRVETDAQGAPKVHRVDGQHAERVYNENPSRVIDELGQAFDLDANVYLIGAAINYHAAFGVRQGKNGGFLFVGDGNLWFEVVAHELGHAFGLRHDFSDGAYLMSYGPGRYRLSACHAEFLAVHPYFNPDVPIGEGPPPTLDLLSPRTYPAESLSVAVRLNVSASAGLHQVFYLIDGPQGLEVKACRSMEGDKDAIVEFQYDGVIPSTDRDDHYSHFLYRTSLSDPVRHPISVLAVDADGNVGSTSFVLEEISPYRIATLEGHTDFVWSVAFSPDSTTLASVAEDGVILWDVVTRKKIAHLVGPSHSVSFSRDGTVLAIASFRSVKLWDVATRENIATLEEPSRFLYSMVLSPDGTTLATGGSVGVVKLWDVTTRENIATLEGHIGGVNSVVFSLDGATLASGSEDGTVKLWDVATRENIATLEEHTDFVQSVAISPDGKLLASGSSDGTALLWEMATREPIAIVGKSQRDITSVAFSPDGLLLAVATIETAEGMGSTVRLWDMVTHERMAAFGHMSPVWEVGFSPNEVILASGLGDGTIALWDVSEWPRSSEQETTAVEQAIPHSLEKVSGDGRGGQVGAQLAEPFVVSVLDQDGSSLAGVVVTFSVSVGGETLSVATTTTDANGRARSTLTLGSEPGTNTVEATVKGLEPETFTAIGRATTDSDGEEDDGEMAFGFAEEVEDQAYTAGAAITDLVLPEATGGEGEVTYRVFGLPAGLSFDAATRTIFGHARSCHRWGRRGHLPSGRRRRNRRHVDLLHHSQPGAELRRLFRPVWRCWWRMRGMVAWPLARPI